MSLADSGRPNNPHFPTSGPTQWIFQEPPAESKVLAAITDNLRAWIEPLLKKGKLVRHAGTHREVTALARALKMEWPRNVLRHSFISYRIAVVKSADQVALEAGNSPAVVFKNYRELATDDEAAALEPARLSAGEHSELAVDSCFSYQISNSQPAKSLTI